MSADRPLSLVIGALGGQGGGVLADWLVEAARRAGFPSQATSIPGVAQRTGATTYYFELFPDRDPPGDPAFCLFPSAGDVDLVAALEPTEAGRALERGHVTGRTTVITATQRLYSTAEKVAAGDGTIPAAPVLDALDRAAKRIIRLDGASLGADGRMNAVLLGAIAGAGVLPMTPGDFRGAIEAKGVAVAANLSGFTAGLDAAANGSPSARPRDPLLNPAPPGFEAEIGRLPEALSGLVGHALARLVDYQDTAYAGRYLERLQTVLNADSAADTRLSAIVARRLAAWMSGEDVVRVAQLKTRPGRLARIRGELGLPADAPLRVTDYLRPGRDEMLSLLPPGLAGVFSAGADRAQGGGVALRIPTASAAGFALLKLIASLRWLRRGGVRFRTEQAAIDGWLGAVRRAATVDYDLACNAADLAIWARGYGAVRAGGLARLEALFGDWAARLDTDRAALAAEVEAALTAARTDPDACAVPA